MDVIEKAKAYDEALERMKSWVRGEHPECFDSAKKAAEFIFPVLKESEGEKIRSCIGMCLTDIDEQRFIDFNTNLKECLAWLEKQGEQKLAVELPIWEKVCLDTGQTILYKDGDRTYLERFGYRIDLKDLDMLPKKKKLKAQKGK